MEKLQLSEIKPLTKSFPNTYSHSINPTTRYLFELKLSLKEEIKMIKKIENQNESNLVSLDDDINYNNIEKFRLTVLKLTGEKMKDFMLEGKIDQKKKHSSFTNENLYIEFCQNDVGKCICKSYFLNNDQLSIILKLVSNKYNNFNFNI